MLQFLKDKLLPLLILLVSTVLGFIGAGLLLDMFMDVAAGPVWPWAVLGTLFSAVLFFGLLYVWHRSRARLGEAAQETVFDFALNYARALSRVALTGLGA